MAAMASASKGEAAEGTASPFDRLRNSIKSLQGAEPADAAAEGNVSAQGAGLDIAALGSWADKARKAVLEKARKAAYDAVRQTSEGEGLDGTSEDVERGEAEESQPSWGSWVKSTAGKVKKQVAEATKEARHGVAQAAERAKSVEWTEQAKGLQGEFSRGFSRVADGAAQATTAISEKGKKAQAMAKDLQGKSAQRLSEAKAAGAAKALAAKEKAAAAASSVKAATTAGVGKVTSGLSGLSALAMSPAKLAQFGGVFFVGVFLLSISFSFLPMLPVAPQKFALLFAFGSMTLLSSFAILKGPTAFAQGLLQREKLPFSVAYAVGLIGTLAGTIVLRSYILTAVFGVVQAVALLYFLASYVPGGQALLNCCGRLGGRAARAVCRQAT